MKHYTIEPNEGWTLYRNENGVSTAPVIEQNGFLFKDPKDMETVERHCEDKPMDPEPYTDEPGNVYDFGFGLSWDGPIVK